MSTAAAHPGRWAEEEQPAAVPNEKGGRTQRFRAQARVGRQGTGKAASTKIAEYRWLYGASAEEAEAQRNEFITHYTTVRPKRKHISSKAESDSVEGAASSADAGETEKRLRRGAAPRHLAEPKLATGPRVARAGPGRGHLYEPAQPLADQLLFATILPPAGAEEGSWFRQMQLKHKWTSERMAQLEQQVEQLLALNAHQVTSIAALRTRVSRHNSMIQQF